MNYLKAFFAYVKPYKKPLRIVYVLFLINAFLNVIPAFSIRYFIDVVLMGRGDVMLFGYRFPDVSALSGSAKLSITLVYCVASIALIIAANWIGVIMHRKGTESAEKVLYDIKLSILNHINKLSLRYFSSERTGVIMTKAVTDVDSLGMLIKNSFYLTYESSVFILAPVLMIMMSPILFIGVMLPLPAIFYSFYLIKKKLKPKYEKQRANISQINSQVQEIISGIKEIKAFNLEQRSYEEYSAANMRYYDNQMDIIRTMSVAHQLQYGAKDLAIICITAIAAVSIFANIGGLGGNIGIVTSYLALMALFYSPLNTIINFFDVYQRGLVGLERIVDFLKVSPDINDSHHAIEMNRGNACGAIRFENVSFSYENEKVLESINLDVAPGQKVAIVGGSGGGKTTLISLLLRFYEPQNGTISIGGTDIRHYTQASLRRNIGIVFQETFLFYGTIRQNLLFVNPQANEQQLIDACTAANIYDAILKMPDGFDTRIGERGVTLSGGQKQRLAIARVFLKDPSIIIFDEATSAVDTETEYLIQESMEKMLAGRTAFIIAHRLSTIKTCDTIIVIDDGRLVEKGTHAELISANGRYCDLHRRSEKGNGNIGMQD